MPVEFADLLTAAPEVSANFMLLEIRQGYAFADTARSQTKNGAGPNAAALSETATLVPDAQHPGRITEELSKLDVLISTFPPVRSGRNPAAQIRT